jgi:hypothetical protein
MSCPFLGTWALVRLDHIRDSPEGRARPCMAQRHIGQVPIQRSRICRRCRRWALEGGERRSELVGVQARARGGQGLGASSRYRSLPVGQHPEDLLEVLEGSSVCSEHEAIRVNIAAAASAWVSLP